MKAVADLCGRVLLIRSGQLYEGSNRQNMIAEYLDEVATAEAHYASLLANTYQSVALPSA